MLHFFNIPTAPHKPPMQELRLFTSRPHRNAPQKVLGVEPLFFATQASPVLVEDESGVEGKNLRLVSRDIGGEELEEQSRRELREGVGGADGDLGVGGAVDGGC